ncbi:MAG: ketose-bisphosphate aldolase [Sphaerochaetaceae bacterium]|jgi:fructose-bisphosphate aldolase class II
MDLVTLTDVIAPAYKSGYAVPAFNFWTYEDLTGILAAAQAKRSPVIVMTSMSCVDYLGFDMIHAMVSTLAKNMSVPVVLHLDHAEDVDAILQAMKSGYTSVMFDGSKLPFAENIETTRFVVRAGKGMGISVEAEIGRVGRGEEGEAATQILTDPQEAMDFYTATGIDALAIAAGTMHGMQKQQADLRFDIIDAVTKMVPVPLVLHGSSGVKNEDFPRLIASGISKINVGTKLRDTFVATCREKAAEESFKNHVALFKAASKAVSQVVADKIERMGSANRY